MNLLRLVLQLVSALSSLGIPPAVTDEHGLRAWIRNLCSVAKTIAGLVPGEVDDVLVELLESIVGNDDSWEQLYALIQVAFADNVEPVGASQADILSAQAGVDPATILQIVMLIVELIRNWKK